MTAFENLQTAGKEISHIKVVTKQEGSFSKLRTLKQCYEIIKGNDPNTAITPYFIRTLCNQGKVDFIKSGNKILVYLESLLNVLNISA